MKRSQLVTLIKEQIEAKAVDTLVKNQIDKIKRKNEVLKELIKIHKEAII